MIPFIRKYGQAEDRTANQCCKKIIKHEKLGILTGLLSSSFAPPIKEPFWKFLG